MFDSTSNPFAYETLKGDDNTTSDHYALRNQVRDIRPELLSLFDLCNRHRFWTPQMIHDGQTVEWDLRCMHHALELHYMLQDQYLSLPETNRCSPCGIARYMILLYSKAQYINLFSPDDIATYHKLGPTLNIEVDLSRKLNDVSSPSEIAPLIASACSISIQEEAWDAIRRHFENALPFAEPTALLLTRGSDDRSELSPISRANKYHATTIPSQIDINRGSCTCASIGSQAFGNCEAMRQELLLDALSIHPEKQSNPMEKKVEMIRDRITKCLDIQDLVDKDACQLILTPSGTDAEYLATSAALSRVFCSLEEMEQDIPLVTSIIIAKGEIGRGSGVASAGKYCGQKTPCGLVRPNGEYLEKYPKELVHTIELDARDAAGDIINQDDAVAQVVNDQLESIGLGNEPQADPLQTKKMVLLHLVMGSKTGFCSPSLDVVQKLSSKYPNRLLVVVDACQMRLNHTMYRIFIERGYIVLVTGSKFFGGAPFCGGIIMPMRSVLELEMAAAKAYGQQCLPRGLADYFSRANFPEMMKLTRERVGSFVNVGLLLRWESALTHMEPFRTIPSKDLHSICALYISSLNQLLAEKYHPMLQILPEDIDTTAQKPTQHARLDDGMINSIVSFRVWHSPEKRFLDMEELRFLHFLLTKDVSACSPTQVEKKRCLLGQPVQIGNHSAVLRIAIGAEMINAIFYADDSERTMNFFLHQDEIAVQKIALIIKNWKILCKRFSHTSQTFRELETSIELQLPETDRVSIAKIDESRISIVIAKMVQEVIFSKEESIGDCMAETKVAIVYDLNAIDTAFQSLSSSFPPHFEHRFAMKTCPLSFFIKRAIENHIGIECASVVEVKHAIRLGCPPNQIVYNSPCKTRNELAFALGAGVDVNADNFDELDIIIELVLAFSQPQFPKHTPHSAYQIPRICLRINPLVGAGRNAILSTSTRNSKFGVTLTTKNRARIMTYFRDNQWLAGLHCHVGSQGCSLELLAKGAAVLCELSDDIDELTGTTGRVKVLNIGGGLPVNYGADGFTPSFGDYAAVLRQCAPQLFQRHERAILTEFGQSISAKSGWIVTQVEYVKSLDEKAPTETPEEACQTAIVHAGSDLFLRACYRPDLFPLRISVYKASGKPSENEVKLQNIAGPLCFGGDLVGRSILVPRIERNDLLVMHDTGANTISLFSRHCSRAAPCVYGYHTNDAEELTLTLLKAKETAEEVMRFWG
ncbi:hypothetical protein ABG067_002533 [Albugo candida]